MSVNELLQDTFGTGLNESERNIQNLKELIENKGIDNAFWETFDAYAQIVGSEAWEDALAKLPAKVQDIVNEEGLESCLDWSYWGHSSFFGLRFDVEDNKVIDGFYEDDTTAYTEFLNAIENAMWEKVQSDIEFAEWEEARKIADGQ